MHEPLYRKKSAPIVISLSPPLESNFGIRQDKRHSSCMKMLGHRNIQNTLLYTQPISFENDDFHSATATTVKDAQKFIAADFEYVTEFEGARIFRKPKL